MLGVPFEVQVGLFVLSAASIVGFAGSLVGLPRALSALPEDYLTTDDLPERPMGRWIAQTTLAIVLGIAGAAMLVLPGQGVLTLVLAVLVSPWRGKKRIARWIFTHDPVFRAVNDLRLRRGVPPLIRTEPEPPGA